MYTYYEDYEPQPFLLKIAELADLTPTPQMLDDIELWRSRVDPIDLMDFNMIDLTRMYLAGDINCDCPSVYIENK